MRARISLVALSCAAVLAGCGGGSSGGASTGHVRIAPRPSSPLDVPAGVPLTGAGAADPEQTKVIRTWVDALRGGDVSTASAQWAVPSTVQNGTPVLKLRSRRDVRLFNSSLPCGAVVTNAENGTKGFTIVTFRLTAHDGRACVGSAQTAIRVSGGKIAEWYALPGQSPTTPDLAPGPQGPTI